MHPEINNYHEIRANYPSNSEEITDLFIGRFKSDGKYHLLGHRPRAVAYMFSAESVANLDLGIVKLPHKKKKIEELVEGDIIKITPTDLSEPFSEEKDAKYISFA